MKGGGLAEKSRLMGRRIDWLLFKLFYEVCLCCSNVSLYQMAS